MPSLAQAVSMNVLHGRVGFTQLRAHQNFPPGSFLGCFFPLAAAEGLSGARLWTSRRGADINNVFCQTHETNLQVLPSTCTGMCNCRAHFARQIIYWSDLSLKLSWLGCCGRKVFIRDGPKRRCHLFDLENWNRYGASDSILKEQYPLWVYGLVFVLSCLQVHALLQTYSRLRTKPLFKQSRSRVMGGKCFVFG